MKKFFSDVSGFLSFSGYYGERACLFASVEHLLDEQGAFRLQNMTLLVDQIPFSGEIYTLKRRHFQEAVTNFRLDGDPGKDGDAHILDDALFNGLRVEHVLEVFQPNAVCFEAGEHEAARSRLNLRNKTGILEQLRRRNAFKSGQRMIRREDDNHIVVKKLAAYISRIMQDIVIFRDHGKGDDVLIERIDDAGKEAEREVDGNVRILLLEFNQRRGEKIGTDGIGCTKADFTAAGAVKRIKIALELAVIVLQMAAEGIEKLSVAVEGHLLAVAVKEGIADLFFQGDDLLGKRRLGAVKRLGSLGHAAVINDGTEA